MKDGLDWSKGGGRGVGEGTKARGRGAVLVAW